MFHHSKFRPNRYSSCISWYDSSQGVFTQSGNKITSWKDLSKNNCSAVSLSEESSPTYNANILNGRPARIKYI